MSFTSLNFLLFLIISVFIYYIISVRFRRIWLLVISCIFYMSFGIRYLGVLFGCTVFSWLYGKLLVRFRSRFVLVPGIGIMVSMLCILKYLHNSTSIIIPIGFSFYILQTVGYLIDIYRDPDDIEKSLLNYSVYMCFFPTIVSGPIRRTREFIPQLSINREFDYESVRSGLYMMAFGYIEKMVVADPIGHVVDQVYCNLSGSSGYQIMIATIFYGIQLYCDFSGYSNIAIGASKILGFKIDANFEQPYFAVSIRDFWHRWHISLSNWLRDYVYFSLGGSRCSNRRKYINVIITFLISGLWHGISFNFIFWGLLHGFYQAVEGIFGDMNKRKRLRKGGNENCIMRVFRCLKVFVLTDYAWMFFRAPSFTEGIRMTRTLLCDFHPEQITDGTIFNIGMDKNVMVAWLFSLAFVFVVDILHENKMDVGSELASCNYILRWGIYLVFVFMIFFAYILFVGQDAGNFIYGMF